MSSSTLRPSGASSRSEFLGLTQALLVCVIVAVGAFEAMWFGVVTDTGLPLPTPQ